MKLKKILLITFLIIIILNKNVFALGDVFKKADSWEETGIYHANRALDYSVLEQGSTKLYNILLAVATVIAVIVGAILGIQFMTAGIEKKVEVKQALFPYIISCTVVFGSFGIWKLLLGILAQI